MQQNNYELLHTPGLWKHISRPISFTIVFEDNTIYLVPVQPEYESTELRLRLKKCQASPLTPMHIASVENAMTAIPSRSFGSKKEWLCNTDDELLTMCNKKNPLPNQTSWTVFRPSSKVSTLVLSVLRIDPSKLDAWRLLPKAGSLLETLVPLRRGFGSGTSPTGNLAPTPNPLSLRFRRTRADRTLRPRKTGPNWNCFAGAFCRWNDDFPGLRNKSDKGMGHA